jgi:predicted MFS family arabinose efflux permease
MSGQYSIRPWSIWSSGALGFIFFQRVAPSAMIGDLMQDFQSNAATIGTSSAFYFYAYINLKVPVGVMADRWPPRHLMTFAAFLCAAGRGLFGMADTFVVAYVGRLLIGCWVSVLFCFCIEACLCLFPAGAICLCQRNGHVY